MAVPALWEVHVVAFHPLVSGDEVDVTPVQRVPNVELSARIGRWSIDAKRGTGFVGRVEMVEIIVLPELLPLWFFNYGVVRLGERVDLGWVSPGPRI